MATQVQIRRGTTAQNNAFVGVVGELTYDTQTNHLITHNGVAAGGFRMLKLAGDTMTGILNISTGIVLNTTGAASFGAGASAFSATGILTVGAGITLNITGAAAFGSAGQLTISAAGLIGFPDGVRQIFNPNATVAGVNVGAQAGDPSTLVNGDIWYDSTGNLLRARINGASVSLGAGGGSSPPFADSTAIVMGSVTPSKLLRFEIDGFTAATTRVLTPQNANYIIAGTDISNDFSVGQAFDGDQGISIGAMFLTDVGDAGVLNVFGGDFSVNGLVTISFGGLVTFPDNVRQIFNPGATNAGINVGALAGDPSAPVNGDLWYDSTGNLLRARINGASVSLGAGGGTPGGADTQVQFNDAGAFGGDAGLSYNKTTDLLTSLKTAIGATPADSLQLINTTAAAAGAQQNSPALRFTGQGWKTAATAGSQPVDFRVYTQPIQGSTNPSGNLLFDVSINGGAFLTAATLTSGGTFIVSSTLQSTIVSISPTGRLEFATRARLLSSADGVFELFNAAQTGFTRLNFGGTTSSFPAITRSGAAFSFTLADGTGNAAFTSGSHTMATAALLSITSGTNQRAGNATLVAGTVTVGNTTVTANTILMLTRKTSGGTLGTAITYTVSAGTSFTINSDSALDTSTFSYLLIEVP